MYDDYICRYFCRIHTANFRGNTKSEDDYLAAGFWLIRNPPAFWLRKRMNCCHLSRIRLLNVTGEVAQLKNIERVNETYFTW